MTQQNNHNENEKPSNGARVLPFPAQISNTANPLKLSDTSPNPINVEPPVGDQFSMEQLTAIQQLVHATIDEVRVSENIDADDDWTLNGEQMLFMLQNHNFIEEVFESGEMESLDELVESDEFAAIFQDMSFDEAYDRYLTMLEEGRA